MLRLLPSGMPPLTAPSGRLLPPGPGSLTAFPSCSCGPAATRRALPRALRIAARDERVPWMLDGGEGDEISAEDRSREPDREDADLTFP